MAIKISALTALVNVAPDDQFVVVDTDTNITKKVTTANAAAGIASNFPNNSIKSTSIDFTTVPRMLKAFVTPSTGIVVSGGATITLGLQKLVYQTGNITNDSSAQNSITIAEPGYYRVSAGASFGDIPNTVSRVRVGVDRSGTPIFFSQYTPLSNGLGEGAVATMPMVQLQAGDTVYATFINGSANATRLSNWTSPTRDLANFVYAERIG